jgi:hypothetical protein
MHTRSVEAIDHRAAVVLPDATDFVAEQEPRRFADVLLERLAPTDSEGS